MVAEHAAALCGNAIRNLPQGAVTSDVSGEHHACATSVLDRKNECLVVGKPP